MKKVLLLRVSAGLGAGADDPVWPHVEDEIDAAFKLGGRVRLIQGVLRDERMMLGTTLSMDAQPGAFRIIYSPVTPSSERSNMLEWWEPGDLPFRGTTNFSHHEWDDRTVCRDVSVAKQIFNDFFENQDLTKVSLDQMRSEWDPKPC